MAFLRIHTSYRPRSNPAANNYDTIERIRACRNGRCWKYTENKHNAKIDARHIKTLGIAWGIAWIMNIFDIWCFNKQFRCAILNTVWSRLRRRLSVIKRRNSVVRMQIGTVASVLCTFRSCIYVLYVVCGYIVDQDTSGKLKTVSVRTACRPRVVHADYK